jgi:hypothetical protein
MKKIYELHITPPAQIFKDCNTAEILVSREKCPRTDYENSIFLMLTYKYHIDFTVRDSASILTPSREIIR